MALLELAEVKAQLQIPPSDTSVDMDLATFIDAAVDAVERHTGNAVEATSFTEVVTARGRPELAVLHGPVTSVESVERLDGSRAWDTSGMVGDGSLIYTGSSQVSGTVRVTYTAGLTDPPKSVVLAAMIIVQHLWETRRGSMPLLTGDLDDSLAISGLGYAIPNRALELLGAPAAGVA